jgi:hypothetical protein
MIIQILWLLLYCLACLSMGSVVIKAAGWKRNTSLASTTILLATSFLLGCAIFANVWMLLAIAGLFNQWVIIAVCVASLVAGEKSVVSLLPGVKRQIQSILSDFSTETGIWKVVIVLTIAIVLLPGSSAILENRLEGDSNAFYLVIAKTTAAAEKIQPLPGYDAYSNITMQGELHYAALMSLGAPDMAAQFVYPISICLAIFLLALARRSGMGRRGQWVALAMLFTSTAFTFLIGDGKVDLFGASPGVAAFFWALNTHEKNQQSRGALFITGILIGFSIMAKLSYLPILLPPIFLLIVWRQWINGERSSFFQFIKRNLPGWVLLGGVIALIFIPNMIKNQVFYQEPLAPIISQGNGGWLEQNWYTEPIKQRLLLTYPLALVFGNYFAQYGLLTPLSLAFAPFVFWLKPRRRILESTLFQVTVSALIGVLLWISLRPTTFAPRYFLTPLLILFLFSAAGAEFISLHINKPIGFDWIIPLSIIFILILSYNLFSNLYPRMDSYVSGGINREQYFGSDYQAFKYLNQHAAPGDRIFTFTYYTYWLRADLIECMDHNYERTDKIQSATEKWDYLFRRGFRYIYDYSPSNFGELIKLNIPDGVPNYLEVTPVYSIGAHHIFEIQSKDPSRHPDIVCKQNGSKLYQLLPFHD